MPLKCESTSKTRPEALFRTTREATSSPLRTKLWALPHLPQAPIPIPTGDTRELPCIFAATNENRTEEPEPRPEQHRRQAAKTDIRNSDPVSTVVEMLPDEAPGRLFPQSSEFMLHTRSGTLQGRLKG